MSRKNKKFFSEKLEKISGDTKRSVAAILLIGMAVILILASLNAAGPAGRLIYGSLGKLFGWGYFLFPSIALIVAILFLISNQQKFFSITFVGAILFIVSGLGLIDILFPGRGGLIGNLFGALENPFGYAASIVIAATFLIASLLITLNASIRFKKKPAEEKIIKNAAEIKIAEEPKFQIEQKQSETMDIPEAESDSAEISKKSEESGISAEGGSASGGKDKKLKPASSPIHQLKTIRYTAPPLSLLKSSVEKPTSGDLRANANIIKRTLDGFGVSVEMGEINIGPKVTRYTLKPAEGIKLSRITALNQDLSLALAAHPIRIEAPIPGKSLVGIEVPNKAAAIVRLGSLMNYPEFQNSGPLTFILCRDVTGEPIIADIEKMPHLLVAGSTGSGKSVALHSLLVSLLYKNSPETLRLILIDPKKVELSVYDGIPHLISPVITDGKKTIGVFRWAIQEMERRYEILLDAGSRDITSYNKSQPQSLPYILLVIDELADLMAAYGREIENYVVRLAQMARATGIHLIVSTQRPSVEVITGLIKANITARVALQVASQVDSRTILDGAGAEKLLGGGDMLFISAESFKPKRIQGAYISEEEINKVADFIKENNPASEETKPNELTAAEALESMNKENIFDDYTPDDDDELYDEAIKVVTEAKKASASLLQRRLKIGYARAARLLDIMEAKGAIGPGDGAKPREVFLKQEDGVL